jgi:hypothetical protein
VHAPIYCRPAGGEFFAELLEPIDISLGGMRIYSHDEHSVGSVLRLEVFFPHVRPVTLNTEVIWTKPLGKGIPVRFDTGLAFASLHFQALKLLQLLVGSDPQDAAPESAVEPMRGQLESSVRRTPNESVHAARRAMPEPSGASPTRDVRSIFSAIPVVVDMGRLVTARVDGRVGYLLWLIDGFISVETILDLSGMPPQETLALLEELVERGVVKLRWRRPDKGECP